MGKITYQDHFLRDVEIERVPGFGNGAVQISQVTAGGQAHRIIISAATVAEFISCLVGAVGETTEERNTLRGIPNG